jgi:DNA-binding response OmpR family regulator
MLLLVEDEKQLADNIFKLLENEGYGIIYTKTPGGSEYTE